MQHPNLWLARKVCQKANEVRLVDPYRFKCCRLELRTITKAAPLWELPTRTLRHLFNRYHGLLYR